MRTLNFAEACEKQGLIFIGPAPGHLREFGLKHRARALAADAGVPLAPGSELIRDLAEARVEADAVGYPIMLKGTAGGGGIGMALCETPDELNENFDRVCRLAESNFGNAGIFLEKFSPKQGIWKSKYSGTVKDEHYPLAYATAQPSVAIKKFSRKRHRLV